MENVARLKLILLLLALALAPIGSTLARAEALPVDTEGGSVSAPMLFVSEPGSESYRLGNSPRRPQPTLHPPYPLISFGLEAGSERADYPLTVSSTRISLSVLQRWQLEGG